MGFGDSFKKVAGAVGAYFTNPAIVGGAMNLAGDYMAMQEGSRQQGKNRQHEDAVNVANIAHAREMATRNENLQREFAQMGIRWRVEDAKAAGLHPLAALGVPASNAAGSSPATLFSGSQPDYHKAEFISRAGQNISRAISAASTTEDRIAKRLQLESMDLDNQLKRKELGQLGPAFPSSSVDPLLSGQGDSFQGEGVGDGRVIDVPYRRTVSHPGAPHLQAGASPDIALSRTKNGWAVIPSRDVKERIEDSPMEWQWLWRNVFRGYDMPDGSRGYMHPITGELRPVRPWLKKTYNFFTKTRK